MSTFLDDLERELLAAHPRRRAARRRAAAGRALRAAPLVLVALLTLAGAGAFVLSVGGEDAPRTPAVESSPAPYVFVPDLPSTPVAVLNGTPRPGLAEKAAGLLGVGSREAFDVVDNDRMNGRRETVVFRAPRHRSVALRIAMRLGATTRRLRGPSRAGDGAELVVALGADIRSVASVPAQPVAGTGGRGGRVGVVDRGAFSLVSVVADVAPGGPYVLTLADARGRTLKRVEAGDANLETGRLQIGTPVPGRTAGLRLTVARQAPGTAPTPELTATLP